MIHVSDQINTREVWPESAGVSKEFAVDMLSKMAVFGASELEPAKSKSLWRNRAPYSDQGRIRWILGSLSHPHYMLVVIINIRFES